MTTEQQTVSVDAEVDAGPGRYGTGVLALAREDTLTRARSRTATTAGSVSDSSPRRAVTGNGFLSPRVRFVASENGDWTRRSVIATGRLKTSPRADPTPDHAERYGTANPLFEIRDIKTDPDIDLYDPAPVTPAGRRIEADSESGRGAES